MAVVLPILFAVVVIATLILSLYSFGVREQIEKMAPEYAKALYLDGAEIFFSRGTPIRVVALFTVEPPDSVRADIRIMRALTAVIVVSIVCLVVAWVADKAI
ncbi:MAG TPA: hypothetical protein VFV97_09520 [Rhodanobacteraceae bacterium]|nr:hypothetical protein [Rhodanobacteraceae bacterium]